MTSSTHSCATFSSREARLLEPKSASQSQMPRQKPLYMCGELPKKVWPHLDEAKAIESGHQVSSVCSAASIYVKEACDTHQHIYKNDRILEPQLSPQLILPATPLFLTRLPVKPKNIKREASRKKFTSHSKPHPIVDWYLKFESNRWCLRGATRGRTWKPMQQRKHMAFGATTQTHLY